MARKYKRKHLRNPDRRMAAAVRLRVAGMSLRQIASELAVTHTTVRRDLARWDHEHPNVVPLLEHSAGTNSPRRGGNVPAECSSDETNVIELRRNA